MGVTNERNQSEASNTPTCKKEIFLFYYVASVNNFRKVFFSQSVLGFKKETKPGLLVKCWCNLVFYVIKL